MITPSVILAVPCCDCGATDGPLNTGNVRPARFSAVRFGLPQGYLICKNCYNNRRYRTVIKLRRTHP